MPIKTNHVPRLVIDDYQLTEAERQDFDYLDWPAIERGEGSAEFFRYRGTLYDLGEFMTTATLSATSPFSEWDGYMTDSFFSGIVIKYNAPDYDRVVVGTWFE
jgi:hypothetical protein